MVMSPQYTVVCCILMPILYVFHKKASATGALHPPDSLPGLSPWTPLGDLRLPDPLSSFMSPSQ